MQTFADRLKQALTMRDKTQGDLVKATNISQSSISDYLNGKYRPNQLKTYLIANYLNVSYEWLLGFDNNIEAKSTRDLRIIDIGEIVKIPVYGRIPAGIPIQAIEDIIDYAEISRDLYKEDRQLIALRISGDSMLPDYKDNDTVIIEKRPDCENGQDCAVYINGFDATLKRVVKQENGLLLQALNPAYETKFYPYNGTESVNILGVVVQLIRKFN
ncbi:MAG: helix-turn-helix domain-containing protein [Eubacteriaceae bacterium]|nr:helix-turn-helix domain-containing protein [Eubacteriaceae bacterium]